MTTLRDQYSEKKGKTPSLKTDKEKGQWQESKGKRERPRWMSHLHICACNPSFWNPCPLPWRDSDSFSFRVQCLQHSPLADFIPPLLPFIRIPDLLFLYLSLNRTIKMFIIQFCVFWLSHLSPNLTVLRVKTIPYLNFSPSCWHRAWHIVGP